MDQSQIELKLLRFSFERLPEDHNSVFKPLHGCLASHQVLCILIVGIPHSFKFSLHFIIVQFVDVTAASLASHSPADDYPIGVVAVEVSQKHAFELNRHVLSYFERKHPFALVEVNRFSQVEDGAPPFGLLLCSWVEIVAVSPDTISIEYLCVGPGPSSELDDTLSLFCFEELVYRPR